MCPNHQTFHILGFCVSVLVHLWHIRIDFKSLLLFVHSFALCSAGFWHEWLTNTVAAASRSPSSSHSATGKTTWSTGCTTSTPSSADRRSTTASTSSTRYRRPFSVWCLSESLSSGAGPCCCSCHDQHVLVAQQIEYVRHVQLVFDGQQSNVVNVNMIGHQKTSSCWWRNQPNNVFNVFKIDTFWVAPSHSIRSSAFSLENSKYKWPGVHSWSWSLSVEPLPLFALHSHLKKNTSRGCFYLLLTRISVEVDIIHLCQYYVIVIIFLLVYTPRYIIWRLFISSRYYKTAPFTSFSAHYHFFNFFQPKSHLSASKIKRHQWCYSRVAATWMTALLAPVRLPKSASAHVGRWWCELNSMDPLT